MAPRYLKRKIDSSSIGKPDSKTIPSAPAVDVPGIVRGVIDDIRRNGDAAVRLYSEKFDKWSPPSFKLSQAEIDEIIATVPEQIIEDIKQVQSNVRKFAEAQKASFSEVEIETEPGVILGHKNIPVQNVGT